MLVDAWLARAARDAPDRHAIETPAGSWTYGELQTVARDGAAWLAGRGVAPAQRVAIALPPGLAFAQALHACMLLGAVAVPVDLRLTAAERQAVTVGCQLTVDVPLWEGPAPGGSREAVPAADPVMATHELDATALVVHTSGTTSTPRPIELSYGNLLWSALGGAVALGHGPDERWLCAMPLSHVGGLSILVRSAIFASTAVVHERFDTEPVLAALMHEGITFVSLVATTLARLLDAGLRNPPALRVALVGGGPVPQTLIERGRTAGVVVSATYGLTESCSQAATVPAAAAAAAGAAAAGAVAAGAPAPSAGPPLFCTRVCIAPGGEILLAGPTVARGSLGADGWLHTGDSGWLDGEGRLHIDGRLSDTIVSGGENVAPLEVEAVLGEHPDVLEVAVVARTDAQWGEAVVAVVVARPGRAVDADALRAHCAARLAAYKVPKAIELRDAPLPRTTSGKLRRGEL